MARHTMQVSYPIAMTRQVRLLHNLTQIHYQKFFNNASARMASIQGLRVNPGSDDSIVKIEEMFKQVLDDATQELESTIDKWKSRLESAGFDPDTSSALGGETFSAPVTTPWSNRYLEMYLLCDRALMLIEMAWIAEEITSVIDKRTAVMDARKPLVDTARRIQRAVTQAFQEAKRPSLPADTVYPPQWAKAGQYINDTAPDLIPILIDAAAADEALYREMVEGLKIQYTDTVLHESLDFILQIRANEESKPVKKKGATKKNKTADDDKTSVTEEPSSAKEDDARFTEGTDANEPSSEPSADG